MMEARLKVQPVLAFEGNKEPYLFKSLTLAASAYGLTRKQLKQLIDNGATAKDGRTSFDFATEEYLATIPGWRKGAWE